jgi:hypothetical protein
LKKTDRILQDRPRLKKTEPTRGSRPTLFYSSSSSIIPPNSASLYAYALEGVDLSFDFNFAPLPIPSTIATHPSLFDDAHLSKVIDPEKQFTRTAAQLKQLEAKARRIHRQREKRAAERAKKPTLQSQRKAWKKKNGVWQLEEDWIIPTPTSSPSLLPGVTSVDRITGLPLTLDPRLL